MDMLSLEYDLIIARHYGTMRLKQAGLGKSIFESQVSEGKPFDKVAFRQEVQRDCFNKKCSVIEKDFCIKCHPNYHFSRDTSRH